MTYSQRYHVQLRLKALQRVDPKLTCSRCGCDDTRLLEINHKSGGGRQEFKKAKTPIQNQIIHRNRTTDDLELLCKPCNHIHYLELKFKKPLPMQVVWTGYKS